MNFNLLSAFNLLLVFINLGLWFDNDDPIHLVAATICFIGALASTKVKPERTG